MAETRSARRQVRPQPTEGSSTTRSRQADLDAPLTMASPARLLVRLCDRLALELTRGLAAERTGDVPVAQRELLHAQKTVRELRTGLRAGARRGLGLARLYDFLHVELVRANVTRDPRIIEDCLDVVTDLADTWRLAAVQAAQQA